MRPLHSAELSVINLLTFCGLDHVLLCLTKTALDKGYTDATVPYREFLERKGIHNFLDQKPGEKFIRYIDVMGLTGSGPKPLNLSLQRPATGKGRFFRVSKLGGLKEPLGLVPDDLILNFVIDNKLHMVNLTGLTVRTEAHNPALALNNTGNSIVTAAKERVLFVMRCMPSCKPGSGNGASPNSIGDLAGMKLESKELAISNSILEDLLQESRIELRSRKPKKYRLCH